MAASDGTATSLITAAAGLAGALFGGFSTYAANRSQWRRESRRTVYANLISAAYGMESFIRSRRERTKEQGAEKSANSDPRTQFRLQLDTAALVAKANTRGALDTWRGLFDGIPDNPADAPENFLDDWRKIQDVFYDYARNELGAPGRVRDRNIAVRASVAALPIIVAFSFLLALSKAEWIHGRTATYLQIAGWIFGVITLLLLIRAGWASLRWRAKLVKSDQSLTERKASERLAFVLAVTFTLCIVALLFNLFDRPNPAFVVGFWAFIFLFFVLLYEILRDPDVQLPDRGQAGRLGQQQLGQPQRGQPRQPPRQQ